MRQSQLEQQIQAYESFSKPSSPQIAEHSRGNDVGKFFKESENESYDRHFFDAFK